MKAELKPHPIAERYPLLGGTDFDEFKANIETNGQRVVIVLFEGKILDGRNRYRACQELGIVPLTTEFKGTYQEASVYSDVLNLHRRHLTREQKREVIAFKLKENPDRSDRAVADEVKASPSTVASVRRKASGVQLGHPEKETRVGRDGKRQKSSKANSKQMPIVQEVNEEKQTSHTGRLPKGITLGNEAINALIRIPKNDSLRARGFQIVSDFIERNAPDEKEAKRAPSGQHSAGVFFTRQAIQEIKRGLKELIREAQKHRAVFNQFVMCTEAGKLLKMIEEASN